MIKTFNKLLELTKSTDYHSQISFKNDYVKVFLQKEKGGNNYYHEFRETDSKSLTAQRIKSLEEFIGG